MEERLQREIAGQQTARQGGGAREQRELAFGLRCPVTKDLEMGRGGAGGKHSAAASLHSARGGARGHFLRNLVMHC